MKRGFIPTIILAACLPLSAVAATYGAVILEAEPPHAVVVPFSNGSVSFEHQIQGIPSGMLTVDSVSWNRVRRDASLYFEVTANLTIPAGGVSKYWYDSDLNPCDYTYVSFKLLFQSVGGLSLDKCDCYAIGDYDGASRLYNASSSQTSQSVGFSLWGTDELIDVGYDRNSIYTIVTESGVTNALNPIRFKTVFCFPLESANGADGVALSSYQVEVSNSL